MSDAKRRPGATRTNPASELVGVRLGAAELGIPPTSLYDLIARRAVAHVKFPGSHKIWLRRSDLKRLVESSIEPAL